MASCDILTCFRLWATPDAAAHSAEANAKKMATVYRALALDAQNQIAAARIGARSAVQALRVARDQKNAALQEQCHAQARAAAGRLVELREKSAKYSQLERTFAQTAEQIMEAQRYKETVGTMMIVKRQMRALKLDGLLDDAENVAVATGDADAQLREISSALAGGGGGGAVSLTEDDLEAALAELEAQVAVEDACDPPPSMQAMSRPAVISLAAYDAALASSVAPPEATRRVAYGIPIA